MDRQVRSFCLQSRVTCRHDSGAASRLQSIYTSESLFPCRVDSLKKYQEKAEYIDGPYTIPMLRFDQRPMTRLPVEGLELLDIALPDGSLNFVKMLSASTT
ncbi:hypothetical protein [Paenibacillus polymyxa]|uniref:hypothetical protein n=1 Tax=Paenibacillus polymyxa TaxID=1406 RepID=UPI0032171F63